MKYLVYYRWKRGLGRSGSYSAPNSFDADTPVDAAEHAARALGRPDDFEGIAVVGTSVHVFDFAPPDPPRIKVVPR